MLQQAPEKINRTERIPSADERALERYFGPLEGVFKRSTFSSMIERLDSDKHFSTPCRRCDGVGFSAEDSIQTTRALRRLEDERRDAIRRGGAYTVDGKKVNENHDPWEAYQEKARELSPQCALCEGKGVAKVRGRVIQKDWRRYNWTRFERDPETQQVVAVTLDARPTKGHQPALAEPPPHQILVEYAKTSRLIDRVGELSPRALVVLEVYYGDEGAVWGRKTQGRMFSLYRLTKAGRQVLTHGAQHTNPTDLGISARLGVEADLDKQQPKVWRRQLLNLADEQARRMYDRACAIWNQARRSAPADWRDRYRELLEAIEDRRAEERVQVLEQTILELRGDPWRAA